MVNCRVVVCCNDEQILKTGMWGNTPPGGLMPQPCGGVLPQMSANFVTSVESNTNRGIIAHECPLL